MAFVFLEVLVIDGQSNFLLVSRIINSIVKDESSESGDDPALKSLTQVFKSLLGGGGGSSSTPSGPSTSKAASQGSTIMGMPGMSPLAGLGQLFPPEFMSLFQNIQPVSVPTDQLLEGINETVTGGLDVPQTSKASTAGLQQVPATSKGDSQAKEISPYHLLKLFEPLVNENVVNEVQTLYEFHIKTKSTNAYEHDKVEVFHLDLKYAPKGMIGYGPSMAKADCTIRVNAEDLNDLLTDKLKPFSAYMSGRIEIDGDLQDVFKLKKLIKSVTGLLAAKKPS